MAGGVVVINASVSARRILSRRGWVRRAAALLDGAAHGKMAT
jgi:hypothetical protein